MDVGEIATEILSDCLHFDHLFAPHLLAESYLLTHHLQRGRRATQPVFRTPETHVDPVND